MLRYDSEADRHYRVGIIPYSMRRKDREIKDFDEIVGVLEKCEVCRIAVNDGEFPYIVPLSFGLQREGEKLTLYFHSAKEGTKLELIKKNDRVSFEADCSQRLIFDEEKGNCTTEYESVVGRGRIEFIEDGEDKEKALRILMRHYRREDFPFNAAMIPQTAVLKLTVLSLSGKRHIKN